MAEDWGASRGKVVKDGLYVGIGIDGKPWESTVARMIDEEDGKILDSYLKDLA